MELEVSSSSVMVFVKGFNNMICLATSTKYHVDDAVVFEVAVGNRLTILQQFPLEDETLILGSKVYLLIDLLFDAQNGVLIFNVDENGHSS